MNNDILHFNLTIEENDFENGVNIIIPNIRPNWIINDLEFKIFTEGLSNKLIGVYPSKKPEEIILFKIYGKTTDLFADRKQEIENHKLLHKAGCSSELYATFSNGTVYEFIPGELLNVETCRNPTIYPLIAVKLAQLHKFKRQNGIPMKSLVWKQFDCFLSHIPNTYSDKQKDARVKKEYPGGLDYFKNEIECEKLFLASEKSPIVFCHNDLLLCNILIQKDAAVFIDYEYAGPNYQAYDIANHFNEFVGTSDFDPTRYPDKSFQISWLRVYLEEYQKESGVEVNDESVEKLYNQVRLFTPLPNLLWAVWALVQLEYSTTDFDYLQFSVDRHNEYKKYKKLRMEHDLNI